MSVTTKPSQDSQQPTLRRIWKSPTSQARWYWLAAALLLYLLILAWYIYTLRVQQFPGPINDPLRLFGIIAFILVLTTATYALRRRFARGLPGKVQDWLWMHTWVGSASILIVLLHENFIHITHEFCTNFSCLTDAYWGTSALIALIFLVISGIVGRLLDTRQTHIIAQEASTNGVGIARALEERILELEYTVERLCAGKSEAFKQYCLQAIEDSVPPDAVPPLGMNEQTDFNRASKALLRRASLIQSLQHQQRARQFMRNWRVIHIVLACLALLIITYHALMELLANVFHIITPA